MIAKPGNKTAEPLWPDPYIILQHIPKEVMTCTDTRTVLHDLSLYGINLKGKYIEEKCMKYYISFYDDYLQNTSTEQQYWSITLWSVNFCGNDIGNFSTL